jgi:putative membrane protein
MMWNGPFGIMDGSGDWGWFGPFHFIIPLMFWAIIITAIVFLARRAFRWSDQPSLAGRRSPGLEVLEERYARGEVARDEYLQKKTDIAG